MNTDAKEPEPVPTWAKLFIGKTPAQFLEPYLGKEKVEAIAGGVFGIADLGMELPEWAKRASMEFWKNYRSGGPLRPCESPEDFGVFMVLLEMIVKEGALPGETHKPLNRLDKVLSRIAKPMFAIMQKLVVARLSHKDKILYHTGCAKGHELLSKLTNPDHLRMTKRALIYFAVAATWRKMETCATHAGREKYLRELGLGGKEFSPDFVTSRAFYDIFGVAGLPAASIGRPRKAEIRPGNL